MDSEQSKARQSPQLPSRSERMSAVLVAAPHPAIQEPAELLADCGLRAQRRGGPGGQHRNKTSSGVFLHHQPTGIVAEATERRSQADNRAVALQRLRYRLAVEVRTESVLDGAVVPEECEFRDALLGTPLRMNDSNQAKPGALALVLNDMHAAGGQPSAVSPVWETTTSAIVRLIRSHPPAFQLLNAIRRHHGRSALK